MLINQSQANPVLLQVLFTYHTCKCALVYLFVAMYMYSVGIVAIDMQTLQRTRSNESNGKV